MLFEESNSFGCFAGVCGGAPFKEGGAELVVVLESGEGCGVSVGRGEFKSSRRWWWDREEINVGESVCVVGGGWARRVMVVLT